MQFLRISFSLFCLSSCNLCLLELKFFLKDQILPQEAASVSAHQGGRPRTGHTEEEEKGWVSVPSKLALGGSVHVPAETTLKTGRRPQLPTHRALG